MAAPERPVVEQLGPEAARSLKPSLAALLRDVVENGASVGFLPPRSRKPRPRGTGTA